MNERTNELANIKSIKKYFIKNLIKNFKKAPYQKNTLSRSLKMQKTSLIKAALSRYLKTNVKSTLSRICSKYLKITLSRDPIKNLKRNLIKVP